MENRHLTPIDLRCEFRYTPLGIGETRPRLSWRLESGVRGDHQTAYQVEVFDNGTPVWNPGWVTSTDQSVEYGGAPVRSSTRYEWRVTVTDANGASTSAESWFETALLHEDEWVAEWISHDPRNNPLAEPPQGHDRAERSSRLAPSPYLRKSWTLDAAPVRARAYVSARGLYELRINGAPVGDAQLAPGWTDYRYRLNYQTYDVTELVTGGDNVVGAVIADGWWSGYVGFDLRRQGKHYGDRPELLVQLVVDLPDGSQRIVATDGTWRETAGDINYADLLMGQYVDARKALTGWDTSGYDDSTWNPVLVVGRDVSTLVAAEDEPVRVTEELSPKSIENKGNGRFIVDFGQNMVGHVALTVRGAAPGDRISLRHAEVLDNGELYTANLRTAEATDVYRPAGEAVEIFDPRLTFHGFRFVEVDGYPGELDPADIVGRVVHSDTPWAGEFRCSDDMVNQLVSNIKWGQRGNFVSVPTDCPQRDERLGWTADAQVFAPTAVYNADLAAFFARWMRDVIDAQSADGAFPDVAPLLCATREGAPAWGDAGVIIPWLLYKAYGDVRALDRSFESMTRWVDYIERENPDLVWRKAVGNHYGDWLQIGVTTPREVLATAYFAHSARLVANAATVLGRGSEAARYGTLADKIAAVFNSEFVRDDGTISGETQTCYLLALAFDLLPDELRKPAARHLADDVEKHGRSLTTGFVGVSLICPILTRYGRADLAYALLHNEEFPSWGYSIKHGATTIWERWDGWTEEHGFQSVDMNSFNHYSLGSVGEWLYRHVAGIDQAPDSVGYRDLAIRPSPGGKLTWAEARYDSLVGRVATRWETTNGRINLDVTIPPGSTATIEVPTTDPKSIRESDAPITDSKEIAFLGANDNTVSVSVGSGHYTFTASLA